MCVCVLCVICVHAYINSCIHSFIPSYMHTFTHTHTCIPAYTNRWRQRTRPPQSSRARALQPSCDDPFCCLRLLSHMLSTTQTEKTGKDSLSVSLKRISESPYIAEVRQRAPASCRRMCWPWWTACPCHSSAPQRDWPWCSYVPL